MNLEGFTLETLLAAAIQSEIGAQDLYGKLASRVGNFMLKDRLEFLASEEDKHRRHLSDLFKRLYPDKEPVPTEETVKVPLPAIRVDSEHDPLSVILEQAVYAEEAAGNFYRSLAEKVDSPEIAKMLKFLANMEDGHKALLEKEWENAKNFEDYESTWPMTHVGP